MAATTLLGGGCSDMGGESSGPIVQDSAGVEIVLHGPATPPRSWHLGDEPEVRLGSVDGDGPDTFGFVSAMLAVDQLIVVGDALNLEVRVFDRDGEHRFSGGRRGQGPGEFLSIDGLVRIGGDTVAVYDRRLQRVSLLSLEHQGVVGSLALNGRAGGSPELVGAISKDHLIFRDDQFRMRPGVTRDSILVTTAALIQGTVDTLGVFPGMEMYSIELGGQRQVGSLPFGLTGWVTARPGSVAFGSGESLTIDVFDQTGRLIRSIRSDWRGEPVDSDARERFVENRLGGEDRPEARRRAEQLLDALTLPRMSPAHSRILYDEEGNLWVAGTAHGGWVVFGSDGELLARVEIPERTFPMQIGHDMVWAVQMGELDQATVVGYPLRKN